MTTPPPDQRQRSIGFYLLGSPLGEETFEFGLRPEEVSYSEPSRLQINQTLGGAWADAFDRGVASISLAGTTGWRGGYYQSGEELHAGLRDTVFTGWHAGRAAAVDAGQDPNDVELWYVDSLNSITARVAPRTFQMRRSKSSPLLMRYNIQLLVLENGDDGVLGFDSIVSAFTNPLRWLLAVTGLGNVLNTINAALARARAAIGAAQAIVSGFVGAVAGLIGMVVSIADQTVGLFGAVDNLVLGSAISLCRAATNGFFALASDAHQAVADVLALQTLGSIFLDAACAMQNGFDLISIIPDYRALRGASACSSTSGGDPISVFSAQDVNPFGYITPAAVPPVVISPDAQTAIVALQGDPLTLMDQPTQVYGLMDTVRQGVVLS